tara:strand:- start:523 stop:747 length:225 start_codon:yes stop_codon:yes gene_type:complete
MGQGIPTLEEVHSARKKLFWDSVQKIVDFFNSSHPFDKSLIQDLVKGGMTKNEIIQFRELTLKAAKAYYGKGNI